jgi:low affinity Fe/Cu permease
MLKKKKTSQIDKISSWFTESIGTNTSLVVHSILFIGIFSLAIIGFSLDKILLILTTAVSLEAIYLAIFIQMSVNKTTVSLASVEEDIDDIQEDVDEIQEDVDDIQEDVDSLESNIKEISDDYIEDESEEQGLVSALKSIEKQLAVLQEEISNLKNKASK